MLLEQLSHAKIRWLNPIQDAPWMCVPFDLMAQQVLRFKLAIYITHMSHYPITFLIHCEQNPQQIGVLQVDGKEPSGFVVTQPSSPTHGSQFFNLNRANVQVRCMLSPVNCPSAPNI